MFVIHTSNSNFSSHHNFPKMRITPAFDEYFGSTMAHDSTRQPNLEGRLKRMELRRLTPRFLALRHDVHGILMTT